MGTRVLLEGLLEARRLRAPTVSENTKKLQRRAAELEIELSQANAKLERVERKALRLEDELGKMRELVARLQARLNRRAIKKQAAAAAREMSDE
jgi:predicted nuclease with TOPRIM domain